MRQRSLTVIAHCPLRSPLSLCSPTLFNGLRSFSDLATFSASSRSIAVSKSEAAQGVRLVAVPHLPAHGIPPRPDHGTNVLRKTVNYNWSNSQNIVLALFS